MNNERDCKHGQLARSCEICGLEAENAALKAELTAMRSQGGRVGWLDGYAAPGASPQPSQARELSQKEAEELAHRRASKYVHRSDPSYVAYTFLPHTLKDFVRDIIAAINAKGDV